jgi:hypothetical protein
MNPIDFENFYYSRVKLRTEKGTFSGFLLKAFGGVFLIVRCSRMSDTMKFFSFDEILEIELG